ncbi:hypothetical protein SAPIO_CDS2420 [Scedosporium apiospermum]|uniref:amidase n=1 Tax=Pseudallescheria apiosperma TaxID=563466 RepID=A0A084GCG1_PSEDA|nr:uncharacterized protein SAPIO_CDS2420 [Scedosporium apiospermum]KEZ45023.1 hypothetical protein SAPIO_CDS2420 [Scedosporium apiospermum]
MTWESLAAKKRASVVDAIPPEWRLKEVPSGDSVMSVPKESGILSSEELTITESSATDLVNCLHDFFPDYALARAKYLDDYLAKHKRPLGPLHGLPVSLKDQCRIKGFETTMGYAAWIGKTDEENSVLVSLLENAGAVFYVKTSVPQSLMTCETINNVFGRTVNPRNKNWAPGGSSGGEGAILGFRGSVLGVGTDIGGSIRVPAAFNFLYGVRPSHGRLPYAKMANSMEGQETIHSVCGPLGHSVEDLRLLIKAVLAEQPWNFDSKVVPMPWRGAEEDAVKAKIASGGLTLGFYSCDGNVVPHPPILRAVQTVVEKFRGAGHTVLPWEPYRHPYAVNLANRIYAADGGADIFATLKLSGEPSIPHIAALVDPNMKKADLNEVWDIQLEKWNYQMEYLARIREFEASTGRELDAIIAPITCTAAIRHDQFKYYGYATAINVLDFTSVVVPVTFADKAVDVKPSDFEPLTKIDAAVHAEYDAAAYHGAPAAVQIIGRRFTEEKIMAIAEELGRLLNQ